jgi:hypothetical protein
MSVIQCQSDFLDPMRVQVFAIHVYDSDKTIYHLISMIIDGVRYIACFGISCTSCADYRRISAAYYMHPDIHANINATIYDGELNCTDMLREFETIVYVLRYVKSIKFYRVGLDWVATPTTVYNYLMNYSAPSELTVHDIYKLFRTDAEVCAQHAHVRIPSISPDPYVRVLTFDNMHIHIQRGNRSFHDMPVVGDVMKFEYNGSHLDLFARYPLAYKELIKHTCDGESISLNHIAMCCAAKSSEEFHGILQNLDIPSWQRTLLLDQFECKPIGVVYDVAIRGFYDTVTRHLIRDIATIVWDYL